MEATALQTPSHPHLTNHNAVDSGAMDTSMDIDMDLDLGPLPEPEPIALEQPAAATPAQEEDLGAVVSNEDLQHEKVHIRGVDELATADIKRFAVEHFNLEEPERVEWIDDTSANIIYSSAEIGLKALSDFTQPHVEGGESDSPSVRLRTAKSLSTHPESVLQVRSAVKSDRKKHRAHEASRFYLLHPEHDPRERLRQGFAERRRHGKRDDSEGDYTRRRFDDREHRRRRGIARDDKFDVSMYDDDRDVSRGRRGSSGDISSADTDSRRGRRRGSDLFPNTSERPTGRLRDRSASPDKPLNDQVLRLGGASSSNRRFRDRSPRRSRDRSSVARINTKKELFPSETNSSDDNTNRRELFPNKTSASYLKKELFPAQASPTNHHHRSNAFDAADETTELFSKRMAVPFVDGAADGPRADRPNNRNVELFPDSGENKGLKIRGTSSEDRGMSIRGASNNGISIKGSAAVRELFPSKYSDNKGKELFSDKLQGRGGQRRKAEDMFS